MNVFAGINSLEDYESSTWGESFYDVEETYETSQQVIRSDPFDDNCLFGKIKFNHKGIVFIVSGGTEYTSIETPFFKYRYLDYSNVDGFANSLQFENDVYVFISNNDKTNFINFIEQYNKSTENFILMAIDKYTAEFQEIFNDEWINYASNLISMFPNYVFENTALHDLLIYCLVFSSDILKTYVGIKKADIERNALLLRNDRNLYSQMNEVRNLFFKYKELIEEKLSTNIDTSLLLAYANIDAALTKILIGIWKSKYDSVSIINNSYEDFKKYIQVCCENNSITIDSEDRLIMLAYFCREYFDLDTRYITDIINEIKSLIKEYNTNIQNKLFFEKITTNNNSNIFSAYKYSIDDIDVMTGLEFENFISKLFIQMGYSAYTTKASGDQGIDVIAEKNGIKYGIQAKCYSVSVGNSSIQEAVAGKAYYSLDKVIVITNNIFTKAAIDLAQKNGVILWDRNVLKEKLMYLN